MPNVPLEKIDDTRYRIPKKYHPGMRVDGIVYAGDKLIESIKHDKSLEQVANVAHLPGIVKYSLAMPDIHWGYGFCVGGVAATDPDNGGVISPGGIGYDINCGIRLMRTDLNAADTAKRLEDLVNGLYNHVPSGIGSKGDVKVSVSQERKLLVEGAGWAVAQGMGVQADLDHCEENGAIEGADPDAVSERAYERGKSQAGTLGSGNHFMEVQAVEEIFDSELADRLGIFAGQTTVMIHSGSRGLGYQVCDDSLRMMVKCLDKYQIDVPDRQLACAPVNSPEARQYIGAMYAAANYAWANRQVLMHLAREVFEKVFGKGWSSLGMSLVYDVAHNIAKFEKHEIDGKILTLCVHRKGATRAFGPGNPELPASYRDIGQPVIIPGDMGRASYLLVGTKKAEVETFGTVCHGAGRIKSRGEAIRTTDFGKLMRELAERGVIVRSGGKQSIVEEAPSAYKDVNAVVDVVVRAGLAKKVCRLRPMGVIKG